MNSLVLVDAQSLHAFTARAFERLNVLPEDAQIAADVLVASDLR